MRESGDYFWVRGHVGRALSGISFWVREPPCECCLCTATAVSYGWSCGWGFKNPARGFTLARLELISMFHPQNYYKYLIYHFEVSSERPPRINKKFRFMAKKLINFRSDRKQTVVKNTKDHAELGKPHKSWRTRSCFVLKATVMYHR